MSFYEKRQLNWEALFKIVLMGSLAFYMIHSIIKGDILLYIHPRLIPYLYVSAALLLIMSLIHLGDIRSIPRRKPNPLTYTLFLIPIITAFLISPLPIDSLSLSGRSISLDMGVVQVERDSGLPAQTNILMDDEGFAPWYYHLLWDPHSYEGADIRARGFLYRTEDMLSDEFFLTRFLMVCCAADMQLAGILSSHPDSGQYDHDTWVEIEGQVKTEEHKGRTVPKIEGITIREIQRPEIPYVYPSFDLPQND